MRLQKCRMCGEPVKNKDFFEIKNVPSIVQNLSIHKELALKQKESLFIFQCKCCELIQLANKPVYYYKNVIRSAGFSEDMKSMRLKQIKQFKKNYKLNKDANVIEIGSGNGEYLKIINRVFPNAKGMENCAKKIQRNSAEQVILGFINSVDYKISNIKYDAFFIYNFLEHIPDPRKFLTGLRNNLSKNSIGIIEVPNFDHMISNGIDYDYSREHLMYFTQSTLKKILTLCGFECLKIQKIWHGHILSAEVRLADSFNFENIVSNRGPVDFIDALTRTGKKIVIWGACHHSFFLVSQSKNFQKISYFVDSANFKIGKYSPGTGIKILNSEMLKKNPPDILLIIASSYSVEVANFVKNNFKEITNIYMLADDKFTKL